MLNYDIPSFTVPEGGNFINRGFQPTVWPQLKCKVPEGRHLKPREKSNVYKVPSLRDLPAGERPSRGLKPTVNKMSSLRDLSLRT